jgi:hypothetical protein
MPEELDRAAENLNVAVIKTVVRQTPDQHYLARTREATAT